MPLSEGETAQYKEVFDSIDVDGSGSLSTEELRKALELFGYKLTEAESAALVAEIDTDGTGTISFEEFIAAVGRRPRKKRVMARLRRLFKRLDTDGNGYIEADDLRKLVNEAGVGDEVTDAQINEVIVSADKSGDGKISWEEFVVAIVELYNENE